MIKINSEKYFSENVLTNEEIVKKIDELKQSNKKIGLCTGSFDILHPGHITHLESAKKLCDVLIVSIAIDDFSTKRKGEGRPVFSHNLRAFIVSKLKPVDYVILDDGDPVKVINLIKPHIYIKGKDYSDELEQGIILAKKTIENLGGKIHFTPTEKLSTTDIINYIKTKVE